MKRMVALGLIGLASASLSACERQPSGAQPAAADSAQAPARDALDPAVRTQLDSANLAFAAEQFAAARAYYRKVTELQPDLSAGWFGVYMAESKLGNQAAADSAIARARKEEVQ